MLIQENYPLNEKNTFHMNVKARWFAEYDTKEELQELLQSELLKTNLFFPIGGGSNLLFTGDYPGVILHSVIKYIQKVEENEEFVWLKVGAGINWDQLCEYAVENGYGGIENLSYIPGEVGASAVQNIGAYGVEVSDVIEQVETICVDNGEERIFKREMCNYGYRNSVFKSTLKGKYIVTAVVYKLTKKSVFKLEYGNLKQALAHFPEISLATIRQVVIEIRKSKLPDPDEYGNAGSFFMNPVVSRLKYETLLKEYPEMPHYSVSEELVKIPAAWLIEQCGWKGKMYGGAAVHEKQCLVLINKNKATAQEIQYLAGAICESIFSKFGITIHPEVNYI